MATDLLTLAARRLLERQAEAYRWECSLPTCDGTPHDGWNYPHARTAQRVPPGHWTTWLLLCGRGFGKTRTGAEAFADMVLASPKDKVGKATEWLVAGKNYDDTVSAMLEGPSGLFHALEARGVTWRFIKPKRITLSTGQKIHVAHGENDNLARSKNLAGAWIDELGTFRRIKAALRDGLIPALRIDTPTSFPRLIVTTTPKVSEADAFSILTDWVARHAAGDPAVVVTRGVTFDNEHNISPTSLEQWRRDYPVGSRSYRQEMLGELCEEIDDAIWKWEQIRAVRLDPQTDELPELTRKIVSVDPTSGTGSSKGDECGLLLMGATGHRSDAQVYVLRDESARMDIATWAGKAVKLAVEHDAAIVVEIDGAAAHIRLALEAAAKRLGVQLPTVHQVRAQGQGPKATRAQPCHAAYVGKAVWHYGVFEELEQQMTSWVPGRSKYSPDRIDALSQGWGWLVGRRREAPAPFNY